MKNIVLKGLWAVAGVALLLLVLHTTRALAIRVDNTSVLLLIIVITCLLAPWLTKIRFGEFEVEISPKEVRRLKETVEKHVPEPTEVESVPMPGRTTATQAVTDLVVIDPVLALAKLRIELERVLSALYEVAETPKKAAHPVGAGGVVRRLTNMEIIPRELSSAITEVVQLCNRAIHGEDVRAPQAETIANQGARLLEYLYNQLSEFQLEPKDVQAIHKDELSKYIKAKYRVVTVIPYVDKPVRTTRVLNQEALDRLLEGYEEYGEFIVEVSKIAK